MRFPLALGSVPGLPVQRAMEMRWESALLPQECRNVEVLSFEQRAKGMAFSSLAVNAAGLLNQFAWPVALEKIQWKTYLIFVIWCAVQTTVIYFFIPETKGRTLEELDEIFEAPNPRKFSTQKKKLELDANANVVNIEGA